MGLSKVPSTTEDQTCRVVTRKFRLFLKSCLNEVFATADGRWTATGRTRHSNSFTSLPTPTIPAHRGFSNQIETTTRYAVLEIFVTLRERVVYKNQNPTPTAPHAVRALYAIPCDYRCRDYRFRDLCTKIHWRPLQF